MADFVDLKCPCSPGYSRGVADLAAAAARYRRMPSADITRLYRAGLVHGLGRLGVSNQIWEKKGPLSTAEWERVRMYPYLTGRILSRVDGLESVVSVATKHEERIDGSGFPRGLAGAELTAHDRLPRRWLITNFSSHVHNGPPSILAVLPVSCAKRRATDVSTPSRWKPSWRRQAIGHRGGRPGRRGSPPGRSKSSDSSRRAGRTVKSPPNCSSPRRRRATTSSVSMPSWASTTARRRLAAIDRGLAGFPVDAAAER
jgi:hypothetical protein